MMSEMLWKHVFDSERATTSIMCTTIFGDLVAVGVVDRGVSEITLQMLAETLNLTEASLPRTEMPQLIAISKTVFICCSIVLVDGMAIHTERIALAWVAS